MLGIKFKDGNQLESFLDDTDHFGGCPTCDFGALYINEIRIETTNYVISLELSQLEAYAFTAEDAIRIFCTCNFGAITEEEFLEYTEGKFDEYNCLKSFEIKRKIAQNI